MSVDVLMFPPFPLSFLGTSAWSPPVSHRVGLLRTGATWVAFQIDSHALLTFEKHCLGPGSIARFSDFLVSNLGS